jgi:membrane protein YfhO
MVYKNGSISWLTASCALAVILVIGNSELVLGKAAPIWDADDYYGPMFSLVADHIKAGKLLLWNPWMNAGSPDFADPQVGAASPFLLVFAFLSKNPVHGFIVYWLTVWLFGAVGMLLLCRHLMCPTWGGLTVALGFMASGFYTGHGEHTAIVYSFSFLPWVTWAFDAGLAQRLYWKMALAGVLWGLSSLGGYPAVIILEPFFLLSWALGKSWLIPNERLLVISHERRNSLRFALSGFCVLGIVAIAVMSPTYVGFLKFAKGYTTRVHGISREYAQVGSLPPQALGTFASPSLYLLNGPPHPIWPETDISMSNIYMGALVISLATISLSKVNKWRLWLMFLVVFFACCALGDHLPLRGWLYDLIPPTRVFRFPSLFSAYVIFAMCVLAAYGAHDLEEVRILDDSGSRGLFVLISETSVLGAALMYHWVLRTAHLTLSSVPHDSKVFALVWFSIAIVFLLWWKRDISKRLLMIALVSVAIYDAISTLKISMPTMYSAASVPWWNTMSSRHVANLDLTGKGLNRQLFPPDELGQHRVQHNRNVVLKIPVLANDTGMVNQFFQPYIADPVLNQLAVGARRIWFSDHPVWCPPNESTFSDYVRLSHKFQLPPLILHSRDQMLMDPKATITQSAPAEHSNEINGAEAVSGAITELLSYSPNLLSFRYHGARDGWLLVTERWAPGWTATVNGREVQVAGADFLFRAIPVSRGENIVVFHYEPRGYFAMLALSWGTTAFVALFGMSYTAKFLLKNATQRHLSKSSDRIDPGQENSVRSALSNHD